MAQKRKMARAAKRLRKKRTTSVPTTVAPKMSTMRVKRTCWTQNYAPSTATTAGFWSYVATNLGNVTNVAEYTALFDSYRINGIKYTLRPRFDNFSGNNTQDATQPGVTNQGGCLVHVIKDGDSTLVPSGTYTSATLNSFLENGSVKTYSGNKAINIYFKPKVDRTFAGVSTAGRTSSPWLSTSQAAIAHNGVHLFFQDVNLTGNFGQSWDLFITYYMEFKGQK